MPVAHNKVIIGFNNEDNQGASVAFNYNSSAPLSNVGALATWANGIATSIAASTGASLLALMDAATSITSVKTCYMLGKVQVSAAIVLLGTPKVGTGTTPHPAQVSSVFSVLTALSGKSYRGRIYWPATGAAIGASGTFSGVLATMAQDMTLFIKGVIGSAAGAPPGILFGVYSPLHDVMTPGTSVRVGNVPDIQRRRRQKVETFGAFGL